MTREKQRIEEAKNRFSDDQIYPASKMYAFVEGAKWADETIINRAIEWLTYQFNMPSDFEYHFRKAMEE